LSQRQTTLQSLHGTFIEQAEAWAPDVLDSFKKLVATGRVEIVAETYYHSLAFFYSRSEFEHQVEKHRVKIKELFGVETTSFRNTELSYDNNLAKWADDAGFKAIITEGWDPVLGWRSPNYVYKPVGTERIKLLMKNYRLSDDIAFRFSNKAWESYPLHADTYDEWVNSALGDDGQTVNLFMDYETFGEHQWEDTGIFEFFGEFIGRWAANPANRFYTVTEAADTYDAVDEIDCPTTITWADTERDLTAWLGNSMQHEAMRHLYDLESDILRTGDETLVDDWRKLTTSDHAYYMCTKYFSDGDVHAYFSPYDSPYDAFIYFMNALRDVRYRVSEHYKSGSF
jgi:alpha-amylase